MSPALSLGLAIAGLASLVPAQKQFQAQSRLKFPPASTNTSSCALGDVNLDGFLDVAFIDFTTSNQLVLYLGDGLGNFKDVTATNLPTLPGTRGWKVAFGRIDRDPFPDLVLGMAGQNRLLLNDRTGKFKDVTSTNFPTAGGSSYGLSLGDVDNDGDTDVMFGNLSGSNALYLNDGRGKFANAVANMPGGTNGAWDATLADVNGDKRLDAFFGNSTNQQQDLYVQDKNGVFRNETATRLPTTRWSTRQVAAGDVDGDGDVDAYYGNFRQQDRLLINNGKGVFKDETSARLPAATFGTYGAIMFDIDEDGDLDVVTGQFSNTTNPNQRITLLLNNGKGVFTDATPTRFPNVNNNALNFCVGDIDGDRDLDLVFANWAGQNGVYFNRHGQLYAPFAPAIGKTWTLEAYARPGYSQFPQSGAIFLGVGPLVPRIPTPWGRLGIMPPLFAGSGFAIAKPGGKFDIKIPIPGSTVFRGISLWFQGLHNNIPTDVRLTNVWNDRIQ